MATDATRSVIPQLARVYLAPVGTSAPADATTALPSGWVEVGHTTPDSLQWTTDPNFEEGRSHQSLYPIRRWQTSDAATLEVDLIEWSAFNFRAVFGGGTITTIAGPPVTYKFDPPAVGGRAEVAALVAITDGTKHYRRIVPRSQQVEGVSQSLNKTEMSTLPLRLSVLGADIGSPWYDLSDDPAFAVAAPTVTTATPNTGGQGDTVPVVIAGTGFVIGAGVTVSGTGVTVADVTVDSATQISATFIIDAGATISARDVTVSNADGGTGVATGAFTVTA